MAKDCGVPPGEEAEVELGTDEVEVGGIENAGGVEEDKVKEGKVGVDGIDECVKGGLDDGTDEEDVGGNKNGKEKPGLELCLGSAEGSKVASSGTTGGAVRLKENEVDSTPAFFPATRFIDLLEDDIDVEENVGVTVEENGEENEVEERPSNFSAPS